MFKKDMQISLLLDFYGEILSERRRELTGLYYNDDLSLSEIAEISGISRQGVRDAVKKSEAELLDLEEKLGLAKKFKDAQKHASTALELCENKADTNAIKEEIIALLHSVE